MAVVTGDGVITNVPVLLREHTMMFKRVHLDTISGAKILLQYYKGAIYQHL